MILLYQPQVDIAAFLAGCLKQKLLCSKITSPTITTPYVWQEVAIAALLGIVRNRNSSAP
jgi:hypothetical protein